MILRLSCGVSSETVKMKVSFHSGSLPSPEWARVRLAIRLASSSLPHHCIYIKWCPLAVADTQWRRHGVFNSCEWYKASTICNAAFLLLGAACKDHVGVHVIWWAFAQKKSTKTIYGSVAYYISIKRRGVKLWDRSTCFWWSKRVGQYGNSEVVAFFAHGQGNEQTNVVTMTECKTKADVDRRGREVIMLQVAARCTLDHWTPRLIMAPATVADLS